MNSERCFAKQPVIQRMLALGLEEGQASLG